MQLTALCRGLLMRGLLTKTWRVVKLTAIILMVFCLHVSANTLSQTISYAGRNLSLQKAFDAIEAQTGYVVIGNKKLLKDSRPVTLSVYEMPLRKFLDLILNGQPLQYEIEMETIIIKRKNSFFPEKEEPHEKMQPLPPIQGVIRNAEGLPLAGASVKIKGTETGATTDANGKFALNANIGDVLAVSYVGYIAQEITVSAISDLSIQLVRQDDNLSEIIVTAFGIEREKKALGYSVQEVKGEMLTEARETNIANSLKGRVAGVFVNPSSAGPGGSSNVIIRGNSSLTGSNQPLYVVDGVPIDNSNLDAASNDAGRDYGDGISNINPDEVESITVLKGPSAASLYGARGANGVILITTKKGSARKGVGVGLNSNATFEEPNVLPINQNKWGGGYDGNYSSFGTKIIDGVAYPLYTSSMYDHWGGEMDGRLIFVEALPELGLIPYTPQPDGNIRDFYRTGQTLTNTVSLSGGNQSTTFRASISDLHNKHILPTTGLNRQTVSLNFSSAITKQLTLEGRFSYVRQEGKNRPELGFGNGAANVVNSLALMARFVDLDWLKDYKRPDGSMVNYQVRRPHNPYWIANEMLSEDTRNRMMGYLSTRYQFTNWLSIKLRAGTDFYNDLRFERIGIGTTGANTIRGGVKNIQWSVREDNIDALLTANGKINRDLTGSFSIGANHLDRRNEVLRATGDNLIVDGVYHISNALNVVTSNGLTRKVMNSVYAMGQLGYKNFLFLDLTGRNDWSSTLGMNNYSFFYPSASLSFAFTDLIRIDPAILSFGKLRASLAAAGNDASPYQTKSGYSLTSTYFNGQPMATYGVRIPLLDLKNELTISRELGMDLRFFQDRLGIDLTYYHSTTKNQIIPIPVSRGSGYSTKMINAGELSNQGIELLLNIAPIRNPKGFNWDITVNFSRNRSKVVSLVEGVTSLSLLDHSYVGIEARPGEEYGNIVGFKYLRTEDGQLLLNSLGRFQNTTTREILGNIQPDFLGGISNVFSYKGFSLGGLIDIRKGGQIFSYTKYQEMANGTGKFTQERQDEMIIEGVIMDADGKYIKNTIPVSPLEYYAPRAWSNIGEEFVIDADYVALREVTLGYVFKSSTLKKTPFSSAKLSIVGRNLLYIYRDPEFKSMGIAPESAFNTSSAAQGLETFALPTTRSLGINLALSF